MVRAYAPRGATGGGTNAQAQGALERVTPLEIRLIEELRSGPPITFADFMDRALYDPENGYYAAGVQRTGWEGDFVTSPEIDPAFGSLWTRAFERTWEAAGRPDPFHVIEVGAGEGGFAEAVLGSASDRFASSLRYVIVERVPGVAERQRERLGTRVSWVPALGDMGEVAAGCVVANEVLDNQPVHLVERRDGALVELYVDGASHRLQLEQGDISDPAIERFVDDYGLAVAEGARAEVGLASMSFTSELVDSLARGALFLIDYGATSAQLGLRQGGTLVTYGAGPGEDVLEAPGARDITAHVNWSAIADACASRGATVAPFVSQREALRALGLDDLHAALRREHEAAVATGRGADAVRSLSRRQALGILTDPNGLGALQVLVASKNLDPPFTLSPDA
jgi:SAM-dependent MidA family methyltransferase